MPSTDLYSTRTGGSPKAHDRGRAYRSQANPHCSSLLVDETRAREHSSIAPSNFYGSKSRRPRETNPPINSASSSIEMPSSKVSCSVAKPQIVTDRVRVPTSPRIAPLEQTRSDDMENRSPQFRHPTSAMTGEDDTLRLQQIPKQTIEAASPVCSPVGRKKKPGMNVGDCQDRGSSRARPTSQLVTPPLSSPSRKAAKKFQRPNDASEANKGEPSSRKGKLSCRARQHPVTLTSSPPLKHHELFKEARTSQPHSSVSRGSGEHQDLLSNAVSGQTTDSSRQRAPDTLDRERKRYQSLPATLLRRADPIGMDPIGMDPIGMDPIGMDPIGMDPIGTAEDRSQPSEFPMNRPALDQIPTDIVLPDAVIEQVCLRGKAQKVSRRQ